MFLICTIFSRLSLTNSYKRWRGKSYVLVSRLDTKQEQEQLNEWEDVKVDGDGNTALHSVRSDAPNEQYCVVYQTASTSKESDGGPLVVVKVQKKVANEGRDTEFVVL